MIFYPKFDPEGQNTVIKIIIYDKSNETLKYKCRFWCEGGLTLNWDDKFSNSENVLYDKSLSRTKHIETSYTIPRNESTSNESFEINLEMTVKSSRKISSQELNDDEPIATTSIAPISAPTPAPSSAFVEYLGNLIEEYKHDSQPDLVLLSSKLIEASKKFDLPDLKKIPATYRDFQISDNNFADILEMAIDYEIGVLIDNQQRNIQDGVRETIQWEKLRDCPLMMLSVLEKLFFEPNLNRMRYSTSI